MIEDEMTLQGCVDSTFEASVEFVGESSNLLGWVLRPGGRPAGERDPDAVKNPLPCADFVPRPVGRPVVSGLRPVGCEAGRMTNSLDCFL